MRCYCCKKEITLARKVKLRPWRAHEPNQGGKESAAYRSYGEEITYRWAIICPACCLVLENDIGLGEIGGRLFNWAGASRGDKAAVIDAHKYEAFLRREAAKLGLEL